MTLTPVTLHILVSEKSDLSSLCCGKYTVQIQNQVASETQTKYRSSDANPRLRWSDTL